MGKKKISYDPDWQEKYKELIATPVVAVAKIHPGKRIFIGTGCAQPSAIIKAMVDNAGKLPNTEIVHLLTLGDAPYAEKNFAKIFRVNSFFIAENVRHVFQEALGDYTPIFLLFFS